LNAEDLAIRDIEPYPTGRFGRALQVQRSASATIARFSANDCHEVSVAAAELASLALTDADIVGTLPSGCAAMGCPPAGIGLGAYESASVSLASFRVARNPLAGIQIASGGMVDLSNGEVSDNLVGVNVQVDGYDISRLMNGVVYRDNGVNLDSTSQPVPDPSAPGLSP
jgi:hypothetical protein